MIETIFLVAGTTSVVDIVVWIVGGILILVSIVAIFAQRKEGRILKNELAQLDKLKKHNVEHEFVIKAMKLCTWHLDPKTMTLTFDYDYRERASSENPVTDGLTYGETSLQLLPEDRERVRRSLDAICSGRTQEYHEQYRVVAPHSQRYFWEESFATIARRDAEGKPESIVGTTMRIDERKSMEEALVAARTRAEESDRLKSAFIANMSHEIRTPLNAIIGFTSLLPDITGDEERRQLIDLIQENNQKLLQIIDDVMNISKIEAGNDQLQLSTFDLNVILSEIADRFTPKVNPGVALTTAFPTDIQMVTTDLSRLQCIMNHLISNAVKFTFQGSITVGYERLNTDRIRIFVRDTGKGIPDELQERVFERFFKVDEFVPGAGLGLSTSRIMAFSLGGTVGLSSKLGEGSTFWLDIPER